MMNRLIKNVFGSVTKSRAQSGECFLLNVNGTKFLVSKRVSTTFDADSCTPFDEVLLQLVVIKLELVQFQSISFYSRPRKENDHVENQE
jgi:hypothetical protein